MKITAVETFALRRQLSRPSGPAGVLNSHRATLFVKISTDAGLAGWGETYAIAGVQSAIEQVLGPGLLGQDPLQLRRLWRWLWDASLGNGFAVGGLDLALHDLWGKALDVPVHQLLGGAVRRRVPAYASGLCYREDMHPAEHWIEEAVGLVEQGFRAVKMRMGRYPLEEELPLVERVRGELPSSVPLMVDAWGSYTFPSALKAGQALEDMGIAWFEEPLPQEGYAGYPELAAQLRIPIAGGETLQSRHAFKALFDRRAVDIVQPDACICGGLGELRFLADLAQLYGIAYVPHTWNGALMATATLHVLATLPEPTRVAGAEPPVLELDATENPFMTETLRTPLILRDGYVEVPEGPGLGVEVDEERIRASTA